MNLTGEGGGRTRDRLGLGGSVFLGLILVLAALAKALEPGAFAQQIQLEGLDFLFSSSTVVVVALALETGLGIALLSGLRRWWILAPATALVAFFLFLTGRNWWLVLNGLRDPDSACGCFGSFIERTAAEAFWQDLLLLVPPLGLALWAGQGRARWIRPRLAVAVAAAAAIALYANSSPDLHFVEMAAQVAGEEPAERFVPITDYRLVRDDHPIPGQVYQAVETVSFLLLAPQLADAVLLRARTGAVETALEASLIRHQDGTITVARDARLQDRGGFEVRADGIAFTLSGLEYRLDSAKEQPDSE